MAGEVRRCVTCDGYGHTCVGIPEASEWLMVVCPDCDGEGWIALDEQTAAQDRAALAQLASAESEEGKLS